MQKEFDGFEHPNHTQVPNDFFDRLLPRIKHESELRVTLAAIRHMLGYHIEKKELSLSFLMQATGMSRNAVRLGVAHALKRGTITRVKKQTPRQGAIYGMRWNKNQWYFQSTSKSEGYPQGTLRGTPTVPLEVLPRYPIKKGKKDKEISASKTDALPKLNPLHEIALALADVSGMDITANRGRLHKEAKQLAGANPAPTPALIREKFGTAGWYWNASGDWRAKQGQKPLPHVVRELWGAWNVPTRSGARSQDDADATRAALLARM